VSELVRIARVRPLEGHWVRIWFTNGVVKDVDLGEGSPAAACSTRSTGVARS
jgi:hypothetical protein